MATAVLELRLLEMIWMNTRSRWHASRYPTKVLPELTAVVSRRVNRAIQAHVVVNERNLGEKPNSFCSFTLDSFVPNWSTVWVPFRATAVTAISTRVVLLLAAPTGWHVAKPC